jgi:integrase
MIATRKLTQDDVKRLVADNDNGKFSDGESLYLFVKNGRGFYVHQFLDFGATKSNPAAHWHTRSHSLGTTDELTLAAARKARNDFMSAKRNGQPLEIRTRQSKGELFSTVADAFLSNHADEWTERTRSDNKALVAKYAAPLASKSVTTITTEQVAETLRPIWDGPGNNRGSRLRRLMHGIFGAASVNPNPARWDDGPLPQLLSRKRKETTHREAMPYADVPAFLKTKTDSVEDRAGRFIVLTSVRRKEGLGATWGEFDFANRVWTIPGKRMKKKLPHAVPLTDQMIALLKEPGAADAFVFPSSRTGRIMGNKALDKEWLPVNPENDKPYTLHGFRTSMSTWAEEKWTDDTGYKGKVIEAALAHAKGDATTQSYLRSPLFEARRKLMEAWSAFAIGA